jgi:hypothetical protein
MSDSKTTLDVRIEDDYSVKLVLDRPGLAGMSYTANPRDLIERIAEAAGLTVTIED